MTPVAWAMVGGYGVIVLFAVAFTPAAFFRDARRGIAAWLRAGRVPLAAFGTWLRAVSVPLTAVRARYRHTGRHWR